MAKFVFRTCPLCKGKRFLEVSKDRHRACPVCGMDGNILVPEDDQTFIPGSLLKDVINILNRHKFLGN